MPNSMPIRVELAEARLLVLLMFVAMIVDGCLRWKTSQALSGLQSQISGLGGGCSQPAVTAHPASPAAVVLESRCRRCHEPGSPAVVSGGAPALYDPTGRLLEPDKAMRVRLYDAVRNGIMPPRKDLDGSDLSPLSDDEFLAVKAWLFPGPN